MVIGARPDSVKGADLTMSTPPHPAQAALRLEQLGRAAIAELRGFPWTRWRDSRTLAQLRMRGRIPSKDGINRRDNDPMPAPVH